MTLDEEKLSELRVRAGWTQKELSEKAGVCLRTLQRALAGEAVKPHMARMIAETLGTQLSDIVASDEQALHQDRWNVLAWKPTGALHVLRALEDAAISDVQLDVEPTAENLDDLLCALRDLRAMHPEPEDRSTPYEDVRRPGPLDQLRMAARLNELFEKLKKAEIAVYVGPYVAFDQVYYYDGNEGYWALSRPKDVSAVAVRITMDAGERILIPVKNRSAEDPAIKKVTSWDAPRSGWNVAPSGNDLDDDIPF